MQIVLDDSFKTLEPVGKKTTSILLDASFILAKKSFVDLISQELRSLKVQEVEFISTALGQAMMVEPRQKGKPYAVVDCGHISTSVAVFKGEGLALLSSFSMGGGHVSSDIMQVLNLNFKDAELIKRKVVLTVESTKNEFYEICSRGSLIKTPINITNQIVKSRIEMIAKVVNNILSLDDVFNDIDIYLTGDGITNFKGVKNILKDITGKEVLEFRIPFDNSKDKFKTSKIGLANLASVVE
jgi:cell division ATPase FtsA